MLVKMKSPAAGDTANGANIEAANFCEKQYRSPTNAAMPFTHVSTAALRVARLASRHGLTAERATMIAPLIFGEGRA